MSGLEEKRVGEGGGGGVDGVGGGTDAEEGEDGAGEEAHSEETRKRNPCSMGINR